MQQVVRKKGRGGGGGKAAAPHPDELIGISPPATVEYCKPAWGSGRKTVDLLKNKAGKPGVSSCPSHDKTVPPGKRTIDLLKLRATRGPLERSVSPVPGHCSTLTGKKPSSLVVKCVKQEVALSGSVASSAVIEESCSTVSTVSSEQLGCESGQKERKKKGRKVEEEVGQEEQVRKDEEGRRGGRRRSFEQEKGGGGTFIPGEIQARLAFLEERVTQLANELKDTKEILQATQPVSDAGVTSAVMEVKGQPIRCRSDSDSVQKCGSGAMENRRKHSLSDNRSSGSYQSAASEVAFEALLAGLECDEVLTEEVPDNQENTVPAVDETPLQLPLDEPEPELCQIGSKSVAAGWFVYEAEGMLLAYEDGSCSFYDVANMEEKTNYKPPDGLVSSTWRDCWLVRAAGMDGRSCKFVVAASAGTAVDPAFCSWNFYEKTVAGYRSETSSWPSTPRSNRSSSPESRRSSKATMSLASTSTRRTSGSRGEMDFPLWWYRPCGPLIACGGSGLKTLRIYDIRDGDRVMKWDSKGCLASTMSYSSPVQWRSRSTLLTVEDLAITAWDVSSAEAQCVHNIDLAGSAPRAVHIFNSDGECNGGVRQRINSKNIDGLVGVVATQEAACILDFRVPSGVAVRIPLLGQDVQSLYANGEALYAAGTIKSQSVIHQLSIRKGQPMMLYTLPSSPSSHHLHTQITQVWGDNKSVMAVNGNGLFVFDASVCGASPVTVIGSDDLYCPTFDYSGSKVLLISRDRPASWQYWPTTPLWSLW